jgi:catechol 2,3-dioxygenase-like lactoylglutathione lyase family enzyme
MPTDTLVRFHLSLNVSDLGISVAFFRTLFGQEPAKFRPDYAKFEPDTPPLVLSLEPNKPGSGGVLNHVGVRMPDTKSLVAVQRRLEEAGVRCQREEGVECCYAKQTKFWLHDPDGTLWEMYTLDGDIDHRGAGQTQEVVTLNAPSASRGPVEWEHRMGSPVPERIPLDDDAADEVRLRGTFNLPLSADQRAAVLAEAVRVLKPGGRLFVHVLTADRSVDGPDLPGPASVVRFVPQEGEPIRLLEDAGFSAVRLLKFDAKPCFVRNGVEMRETQIEGRKPLTAEGTDKVFEVLYRGPFDQIDADGRAFPRGVRVGVPAGDAARFRTPELAAQFTVFEPSANRPLTANACG